MYPSCHTPWQQAMNYFEFPLKISVFTGDGPRDQGLDRVVSISPRPGLGPASAKAAEVALRFSDAIDYRDATSLRLLNLMVKGFSGTFFGSQTSPLKMTPLHMGRKSETGNCHQNPMLQINRDMVSARSPGADASS